jgi:hypothetical protein
VVLPRLLDVVIMGRALPDLGDGLKPVHHRILLWPAGGGPLVQQQTLSIIQFFIYWRNVYPFFWISSG